jgi:uncharacterized phage protein gp47/JayE
MAQTPLSVAQIASTIITDVETKIGAPVPILAVAFVRVLAKAIAGVLVLQYKYTGFMYLQLFVSTASAEPTTINGVTVTPLIELGRLVGAGDPVPAVPAELTATVTVTNQTGDPIIAGTQLVYSPTGVIYLTTATVLRDAATKTINIVAVSDQTDGDGLGAIGNLEVGDLVSFTSPIADALRDAPVASVVTSGEDAEPTPQYRQRVIDRFQKPPQGGALADYEIWGEEAAGIINLYPYVGIPGTVNGYCEADPVSSGSPDGIPTQPQLDAVEASVNLDVSGRATRRPANSLFTALPITRKEFEVDVHGLDAPDMTTTTTAIQDAMDTLFATYEPFIGGLTVIPRDRITIAEVSGVVFDVAQANNATFSTVLLKTNVLSQTSYNALVTASANDASEVGGSVNLTGAVLNFDATTTTGFRFVNVNIPPAATILSATLTFTSPSAKNPYSVVTIRGESVDDAPIFTTGASNISARATTVNSTVWIPGAWSVDSVEVVDLKSSVEEILLVPGWAALNSMAFIATAATGSDREVRSYDDDPLKAAQLDVTYQSETVATASVQTVSLVEGQKAKVTTTIVLT